MNYIGKTLVLIQTAISLFALAGAAGLYLQFIDWGWAEPRTDMGLRVPSEYDKRTAAFKEAVKARDLAWPFLKPARLALVEAQQHFGQNHLFYNQELARLQSAPDAIEVKYIKKTGPIVLDTPGKDIGKPVLEEKIPGITKSYDSYLADLKKINEDVDKEIKQIRDWTEKSREITYLLNAKDDAGKAVKTTVGMYTLLDTEKKAQDQAIFEKEYLQPIWARAIDEADTLLDRRMRLQQTLSRLQGGKKK